MQTQKTSKTVCNHHGCTAQPVYVVGIAQNSGKMNVCRSCFEKMLKERKTWAGVTVLSRI